MESIQISTTQNVSISYPLGSIGDRIGATAIDWGFLGLYSLAVYALFINIDMKMFWVWLVAVGGPWLFYSLAFEITLNGQTPGKRILHLKVIRTDGTPATLRDYILRWIFRFVDVLIAAGAVGVFSIIAGAKGQRLGDVVAGTTVIKTVEPKEIKAADIFITPPSDYTPVFSEVIQLNERDIELIQRALEANKNLGNLEPVAAVAGKVKSLLGVQTEMPPVQFLYTIVKDFNHLTSR